MESKKTNAILKRFSCFFMAFTFLSARPNFNGERLIQGLICSLLFSTMLRTFKNTTKVSRSPAVKSLNPSRNARITGDKLTCLSPCLSKPSWPQQTLLLALCPMQPPYSLSFSPSGFMRAGCQSDMETQRAIDPAALLSCTIQKKGNYLQKNCYA